MTPTKEAQFVEALYKKYRASNNNYEKTQIIDEILGFEKNLILSIADVYSDLLSSYNIDLSHYIEYFTNTYKNLIINKNEKDGCYLRTRFLSRVKKVFVMARKRVEKLESSENIEDEILTGQVFDAVTYRHNKFLETKDFSLAQEISEAEYKKIIKLADKLFEKTGVDYFDNLIKMYMGHVAKHLGTPTYIFNSLFAIKYSKFAQRKLQEAGKIEVVTYGGASHLEGLLGKDQILYDGEHELLKGVVTQDFMSQLDKRVPSQRLRWFVKAHADGMRQSDIARAEVCSRENVRQSNERLIRFIHKNMPKRVMRDMHEVMLEDKFEAVE